MISDNMTLELRPLLEWDDLPTATSCLTDGVWSPDMTWDDLPTATSCLTKEKRTRAAENALYGWACDHLQQKHVKKYCLDLGFVIDFRQADVGPYLQATYFVDGESPTNFKHPHSGTSVTLEF